MCKRIYETSVASLTISRCGECPAHQCIYNRSRLANGSFTTTLSHIRCYRTSRKVPFSEIDRACPLPVAPSVPSVASSTQEHTK